MNKIVIGIDPGTKTAGICVLTLVEGQDPCPALVCQVELEFADAYEMAIEIISALRPWTRWQKADLVPVAIVEDYVERHGSSHSARVLEVIGVLRYILRLSGLHVRVVSHASWRAAWRDNLLTKIARGEALPAWMIDLKEHEADAAKMAWLEIKEQIFAPVEPAEG